MLHDQYDSSLQICSKFHQIISIYWSIPYTIKFLLFNLLRHLHSSWVLFLIKLTISFRSVHHYLHKLHSSYFYHTSDSKREINCFNHKNNCKELRNKQFETLAKIIHHDIDIRQSSTQIQVIYILLLKPKSYKICIY